MPEKAPEQRAERHALEWRSLLVSTLSLGLRGVCRPGGATLSLALCGLHAPPCRDLSNQILNGSIPEGIFNITKLTSLSVLPPHLPSLSHGVCRLVAKAAIFPVKGAAHSGCISLP